MQVRAKNVCACVLFLDVVVHLSSRVGGFFFYVKMIG